MTQQNVRGAYMNFMHDRAADWDWLAKWQPNVIRLMLPGSIADPASVDVQRIRRVHDTCPEATLLIRVWEVDDRNFEAHAAMEADPQAEAERQLDWWARLFDRAVGVPRPLLMAGLNNETGPEKDNALYVYTQHALKLGLERAVRCGAFVFSVGRPSLPGESQYDMDYFSRLESLFLAGDHAMILHEYMQPEGMYAVWRDEQGNERKDYTYLIGRHARWPMKRVPKIIGEWGIDGILYNRHPDPQYGNSGWRNFKDLWTPDRYADEYVECVRQADPSVIGICPFLSDFADHKWQSFDLLEAYPQLIARKHLCVKDVATPPVTTHIPVVIAPIFTELFIVTRNAANVRTAPSLDARVLDVVDKGTNLRAVGETSEFYQIEFVGALAYIHKTVVRPFEDWQTGTGPTPVKPPTPPVEVQPAGDNWERAISWILRWEGGFQANPADVGNYYDGKLVGTKYGISAKSWGGQYDIPNLTLEQAKSIYFEHYWKASGASGMAWPLCLLVLDTAVLHGTGTAQTWFAEVGNNAYAFAAKRLRVYTKHKSWSEFGAGWTNRVADLLEECGKS